MFSLSHDNPGSCNMETVPHAVSRSNRPLVLLVARKQVIQGDLTFA